MPGLTTKGELSPRVMYDPASSPLTPAATIAGAPLEPVRTSRRLVTAFRPSEIVRGLVGYYQDPLAWFSTIVTSFVMCYVGGAAMFWYHGIHLEEGGPAISWEAHWFLDSTIGFIALTPAVLVILPLVNLAAQIIAHDDRSMRWVYALVTGAAFGFVTIPGPLVHNLLVSRGTWLANHITQLIGNPNAPIGESYQYSGPELMRQQFQAGLPVYVLLAVVTLWLIRGIVAAAYRSSASALAAASVGATAPAEL
jgi:hypothetical protein